MTINGIGEASARKIVEFRVNNSISSWQIFHELAPKVEFAEMARLHQAGEWNSYIKVFKISFGHNSKAKERTDSFSSKFDLMTKGIEDRHQKHMQQLNRITSILDGINKRLGVTPEDEAIPGPLSKAILGPLLAKSETSAYISSSDENENRPAANNSSSSEGTESGPALMDEQMADSAGTVSGPAESPPIQQTVTMLPVITPQPHLHGPSEVSPPSKAAPSPSPQASAAQGQAPDRSCGKSQKPKNLKHLRLQFISSAPLKLGPVSPVEYPDTRRTPRHSMVSDPGPPIRKQQWKKPSPYACHGCGGRGHYVGNCATRRNRSTSAVRCYECGGRGHISFYCGNHQHHCRPPASSWVSRFNIRNKSQTNTRSDSLDWRATMRPPNPWTDTKRDL